MPSEVKSEPISRRGSLKDLAYQEIRNLLVSGRLEHDQLYSAQHFADMLGISRTPAREALLRLAGEGFLVCYDVRGFQVRQFSDKEIRDLFEVRQLLETFAVRQLADTVTVADLRQLKATLRSMIAFAEKRDVYGFLEADKDFHMSLVRRSDNQMLISIMENIRSQIAIFGAKVLAREQRFQEVIREHRSILAALVRKDRKRAVQAVARHLSATQRNVHETFPTVAK